jgi:hypothetical protein
MAISPLPAGSFADRSLLDVDSVADYTRMAGLHGDVITVLQA